MNSLRREPTIIQLNEPWDPVVGRMVRRSMRNNTNIMERWNCRKERRQIQKEILVSLILKKRKI